MVIKDLKDLEKVVKLCRKLKINAMEIDNIKFNLEPMPKTTRSKRSSLEDIPEAALKIPQYNPSDDPDVIKTDELTPEQLLNWSVMDTTSDEAAN